MHTAEVVHRAGFFVVWRSRVIGSTGVPEGFFLIRVHVTAAEYDTVRDLGLLTAEGTPAAGFRVKAGLPESPYGIKTARLREAIADADEWYAEHGLLDGDINTHAGSTGEDL